MIRLFWLHQLSIATYEPLTIIFLYILFYSLADYQKNAFDLIKNFNYIRSARRISDFHDPNQSREALLILKSHSWGTNFWNQFFRYYTTEILISMPVSSMILLSSSIRNALFRISSVIVKVNSWSSSSSNNINQQRYWTFWSFF